MPPSAPILNSVNLLTAVPFFFMSQSFFGIPPNFYVNLLWFFHRQPFWSDSLACVQSAGSSYPSRGKKTRQVTHIFLLKKCCKNHSAYLPWIKIRTKLTTGCFSKKAFNYQYHQPLLNLQLILIHCFTNLAEKFQAICILSTAGSSTNFLHTKDGSQGNFNHKGWVL